MNISGFVCHMVCLDCPFVIVTNNRGYYLNEDDWIGSDKTTKQVEFGPGVIVS